MNNLSDVASKLKGKAVAAASSFKRRFAALGKEIWKRKIAYLFIAPLIIGLLIFSYYPPVYGLALSFFEKHSVGETVFVGFANYANLFKDDVFLRSIPTMFYIMIPRLLIGIVVPLVMAELIFSVKSEKLQGLYRVLVLVPIVAPGVVGTLIWRNIFDPTSGLLTTVARLLGFMKPGQVIDWLGNPDWVIPSIIFMGFPWIGGTSVLIYMSGLMGISSEVLEASRLDGASVLYRIWKIDIPLLLGQIRYFLIFGLIGGFQDYGTQIVLTDGGPGYSTYVPGYYMYQQAFMHDNMGYASAIGSVMFVVIMAVSLFAFKFVNTKNIQGLGQEAL